MSENELIEKKSIAKIYINGIFKAMGFLINDHHIMTCHHIFSDEINCGKNGGKPNPYAFRWNEIPGEDNGILVEFLIQKFGIDKKFGIDRTKPPKIEKTDDDKTIKVSSEKKSLSLNLNDRKDKVVLELAGTTLVLAAEMENGELSICPTPSISIQFLSVPNETVSAKIIGQDSDLDFTILELFPGRLDNTSPAYLLSIKDQPLIGHKIRCYGFPEGGETTGIFSQGKIVGWLKDDLIHIEKLEGSCRQIKEGFSGSLVWDEDVEGAIGMIIGGASDIGIAMAIPLYLIEEKLPELSLRLPPQRDQLKECDRLFHDLFKYLDEKSMKSLSNICKMRNKLLNQNILFDIDKINETCRCVIRKWNQVREDFYFADGTMHDYIFNLAENDDIHCIFIEEKIYELLFGGDIEVLINSPVLSSKLNPPELQLLLLSAWLHDIGMIPNLFREDMEIREENDYKIRDFFRYLISKHHLRSSKFIERMHIDNFRELRSICEYHRHKEYNKLYEEFINYKRGINIPLIASYLRLAGAIQVPRTTKIEGFVHLGFEDPYSMFQWLKSHCLVDSKVMRDENKIEIYTKVPSDLNDKEKSSLKILKNALKSEIQNEADFTREIFIKNNVGFYVTVECIERETIMDEDERRDFIELLANIELFVPMMSPNASAVIDIVLKQILSIIESSNNQMKVFNNIKKYKSNVLDTIVAKRPCHVFFNRFNDLLEVEIKKINMLVEKLKSFDMYENNGELESLGIDPVREQLNITHYKIKSLMERRTNILETLLPVIAYSILIDSTPILLYGYSSSIKYCLIYAIEQNPKIKDTPIYICEATTKREYRYNNRLVYSDGIKYLEELKSIGMKNLNYIADACASNLFSRYKISKVLFGANGIDFGGNVHHTLGHLAIADMASKYKIKTYVIAESLKIGIIHADPEVQRENQWLTTDIDQEIKLLSNTDCIISNYNPRGDKVPPSVITAIITENGIASPAMIKEYTEIYWYHRGIDYFKKKSYHKSLECFIKALSLYSDDECTVHYKGKVLEKLKREIDARKEFELEKEIRNRMKFRR